MILGFKKQFVDKIIRGDKIHTIREDPTRRWKPGNVIHFATGVRTKNYNQFHEDTCRYVHPVWIDPQKKEIHIGVYYHLLGWMKAKMSEHAQLEFAQNDGFDTLDDFWEWFDKPFHGVVIHWTNKRYECESFHQKGSGQ